MAAASYNTDLTDLLSNPDTGETTANWAAIGGGASGLAVETDYFVQGTNCVSKAAWAGAAKGMIEDTTNTTLSSGSGNAVYMWVTHLTPASLGTKAQGGIRVLLGSATNTYNEYYYAGSDTIDYGAPWICAVVDPDNATANSGSVTTATMDCYGAIANLPTTGPTKGAPFGIDATRYGRSIEINDGAGAPANFTDMASANDAVSARWGQFQRTPGSTVNFTMQCRIEFGDTTNTTACTFSDSNKNVTINDLEFVATDFIEFDVTQGSTVSLDSCSFVATSGGNTRGNWVTTSATSVDLTSCTFANMGTFGFDSAYTVTNCTFRGCDQITLGSGSMSNCNVTNATVASGEAAVITSDLDNFSGGSITTTGTGHAIELTTASDASWTTSTSGYRAGTTGEPITPFVVGSTANGNETVFISATSGTFNIAVSGVDTPSVAVPSGFSGTINITGFKPTLTLTGLVANSEVRIYAHGTTTELTGVENSGTTFSYQYAYAASTYVDIVIHKADYKYYRVDNYLLGSGDASLPIAQIFDRNYNNP
jgi:hypothetical protein